MRTRDEEFGLGVILSEAKDLMAIVSWPATEGIAADFILSLRGRFRRPWQSSLCHCERPEGAWQSPRKILILEIATPSRKSETARDDKAGSPLRASR